MDLPKAPHVRLKLLCLRRGLAAVLLTLLTVLPAPPVAGQTEQRPPRVETIKFTGNVPWYSLGATIEVTVTFSEAVVVTGRPQLALPIGSTTRYADYHSGSSSPAVVFHYTVTATDEDTDGVAIAANALALNGGSIKSTAAIDADITHDQTHSWPLTIDGIAPVLQTAAVYGARLVLLYNELLWENAGTPARAYTVMVNDEARTVTRVSISGRTVALSLDSAVEATDRVTVRYTVGTHPVRDWVDNNVAALSNQAVTTSAPSVTRLEITSVPAARHTYAGGEVIEVTVTFSESVTVTGAPQLWLAFSSTGRYQRVAQYVSGSGTTALVFRHVVTAGISRGVAFFLRFLGYGDPEFGDEAPDGLSIAADALHLNDGTIRDSDSHDAWLKLDALTNAEGHKVDGRWPELVSQSAGPLVVNRATLTVRYDETLDTNSVPPSAAFKVTVNDAPNAVTSVSITASTVTVTLRTPVRASDTVRLSYTAPTESGVPPIQDVVGNNAADFNHSVRNDTVGVTVTAANPLAVAEGGSHTYTVVLDSQPTHAVTITPASDDAGAATVSPVSHTFTPANWDTARSFTVSGLSDEDTQDERVRVSHQAASDDAKYDGIVVGSVAVAVTDDDTPQPQEQDPPSEAESELQQQAQDPPIKLTGTNGPDDLEGGDGDDLLIGKKGDDVLRGGKGDDELRGGKGADELHGGRGADTLVGGNGDDELHGDRGADRLLGGNGDDIYTGGPGADRFVFFSGETGDKVITDFGDGADRIVLRPAAEPWPSVAAIIAGEVAEPEGYWVYTLAAGLTVETDTPLEVEDFLVK